VTTWHACAASVRRGQTDTLADWQTDTEQATRTPTEHRGACWGENSGFRGKTDHIHVPLPCSSSNQIVATAVLLGYPQPRRAPFFSRSYTVGSANGIIICPSVRPSVCSSVTLCIVAFRVKSLPSCTKEGTSYSPLQTLLLEDVSFSHKWC